MNVLHSLQQRLARGVHAALPMVLGLVLAACGGSADAPPPPEPAPPQPVPPTITQQPANLSVISGQSASFTVAATGTAPLSYQWQRGGVNIAGATGTTYTIATTVAGDSGAIFRAVVSNVAGTATSNTATLTVTVAAPVLTITQQPANTSVVAGTQASFSVAATCSSGTLGVQWQRSSGSGANLTWADIAGATATSYSLTTSIGDTGTQFRAQLNCSGQSATASNAATLTVTAPGSVTLSLLPIVGLRDQAQLVELAGIDQDAGGSFTFINRHRIMRLSADLSSIDPVAGSQAQGSADGVGAAASFNLPQGLTQDAGGVVYVTDRGNHTIRRIATDGTVTTIAGLAGTNGNADGTGTAARFDRPSGIALGPDGALYVADENNHRIRRVTTGGVVTTYAGSVAGYLDGVAATAQFNSPFGVAVAANGDVLVADSSNHRVRRILRSGSAAGAVETLAGNGGTASTNGTGTAAGIALPRYLHLRGNTLTVRDNNGLLRQIDVTSAAVTTLTGTAPSGYADGPANVARLSNFGGVTGAANGGFMLADFVDSLRAVSAAGEVRTIASGKAVGVDLTGAGTGVLAQMPMLVGDGFGGVRPGLTVDSTGNVIVADWSTKTVRRISPAGAVTLVSGLVGAFSGPRDGIGSVAQLISPGPVVSGPGGELWFIDNHAVRRIGTDGNATVLAGSPTEFGALDGGGSAARFNGLFGIARNAAGDIFVAANAAIRRIDAAGNVTTYSGTMGVTGFTDGPTAGALFTSPRELAFGPDGTLYIVDSGRIRRISADGLVVSTLPGIFDVKRLTVDASGTLFYGTTTGLWMLPGTGSATLLIAQGPAIVLGNVNPRVMAIDGIAVLGPKRLVLLSGTQVLQVTLP